MVDKQHQCGHILCVALPDSSRSQCTLQSVPASGIRVSWPLDTCRAAVLPQVPPAQGAARAMLVVALADTPTLWKYGGPDGASSAPLLVARWVALPGAPPVPGLEQAQPLAGPLLSAGATPARFWSGNVSGGRGS